MDVWNKKEDATKSVEENGSVLDDDNVEGKDKEAVENYETSPELTGVFYEEILNEDELQKLKAEFSRLKSQFNLFPFLWICYINNDSGRQRKIFTRRVWMYTLNWAVIALTCCSCT